MKDRPRRTLFVFAAVAGAAVLMIGGSATAAGQGSFSGTITPTSCGPMHDVQVVQGDTAIDAVAAEYVSANDITLDLYSPTGQLLKHGDTLTSPESVHYSVENMQPGTYHLQVCPFQGGLVSQPYDYTGSYAVSNGPVVAPRTGSTRAATTGSPALGARPHRIHSSTARPTAGSSSTSTARPASGPTPAPAAVTPTSSRTTRATPTSSTSNRWSTSGPRSRTTTATTGARTQPP